MKVKSVDSFNVLIFNVIMVCVRIIVSFGGIILRLECSSFSVSMEWPIASNLFSLLTQGVRRLCAP